mmetsp:Transcript_134721/g.300218  ORF Transcript_134721/g.300218 Transcript_134721/m.300218 type:complete len:294 (+) Transcript_134721:1445-2326(+)
MAALLSHCRARGWCSWRAVPQSFTGPVLRVHIGRVRSRSAAAHALCPEQILLEALRSRQGTTLRLTAVVAYARAVCQIWRSRGGGCCCCGGGRSCCGGRRCCCGGRPGRRCCCGGGSHCCSHHAFPAKYHQRSSSPLRAVLICIIDGLRQEVLTRLVCEEARPGHTRSVPVDHALLLQLRARLRADELHPLRVVAPRQTVVRLPCRHLADNGDDPGRDHCYREQQLQHLGPTISGQSSAIGLPHVERTPELAHFTASPRREQHLRLSRAVAPLLHRCLHCRAAHAGTRRKAIK